MIRYDAELLSKELSVPFRLRSAREYVHTTPDGREQSFLLCDFELEQGG